eukprot:gnl/TRDRNA2_/TRDRNA2_61654_c0_seq2.p1 gnl/TRDRNA2_/TRDRNA2_61654_c0~~gnl/TRDRNA2_/TRDRNA2_61654_c0_seq2.p1  ORF type:complete len:346 (+),score=62.09 gnl/TRDRNA2_/TRDRNA2_61654_c0_seq2:57-1094(+)
MADDFDLYEDLEELENGAITEELTLELPKHSATASSASPSLGQQGSCGVMTDSGEQQEDEAVKALLKSLTEVDSGEPDDECAVMGDSLDGSQTQLLACEAGARDDDVLLCTEDAMPPLKQRRVSSSNSCAQETTQDARGAAGQADDDFDFEADIQESSRDQHRQAIVLSAQAGKVPESSQCGTRAKTDSSNYSYNSKTKRWELGRSSAEAGPDAHSTWKTSLCRNNPKGTCRFGASCRYAHSESELRGAGAEALKRRIIAQCSMQARVDAHGGACEFPLALAVRLVLRFEDRPADVLPFMVQAGLPLGEDKRTAVKALLRLCHPDKCPHPEAKRAVQILAPLKNV